MSLIGDATAYVPPIPPSCRPLIPRYTVPGFPQQIVPSDSLRRLPISVAIVILYPRRSYGAYENNEETLEIAN